MKRIILMVFRNLFLIPYMWIRLNRHAKHADQYTDMEHYLFLRWIVERANRGGNVQVVAEGVENIPKENGFMYYPNHQGMYDILALLNASTAPFSVVAKIEVKDVPFLKQVIACLKGFTLDREDVRQAMQVIMKVTQEVKKGRNYVIFAEGTRSKNGNVTQDFKGGSFKAATKAKCPIVPVALLNSFAPFDTHDIKPVTVYVRFLEPLLYEDYKDMKTLEIAALVKERIDTAIEECSKKEGFCKY